jgi:hypothetical protein
MLVEFSQAINSNADNWMIMKINSLIERKYG